MNRIFLVRHGENLANITKEFSCRKVDYSLTEKGLLQSVQTAEYFSGFTIDKIISSPLMRAVETASIIGYEVNIKPTIIEEFREINVGELEGMPPDKISWNLYRDVIENWIAGKDNYSFPGGEDLVNVHFRFLKGLNIATGNSEGKTIIVVGHAGIFTFGLLKLCNITDRAGFIAVPNHNCSISELLIDKNKYSIGRWADHSHLSGIAARLVSAFPEFEEKNPDY